MNQTNAQGNISANPIAGNIPSIVINAPATGAVMHQSSPMQMQQGPTTCPVPQQAQLDKMDYISKVKVLMGALTDTVPMTIKSAAQILHQNCNSDSNSHESTAECSLSTMAFDNNLDEFFSLCDQMEMHLQSALACVEQTQAAARYIPLNVNPSILDPPITPDTLSYTAYVKTAQTQVKETYQVRKLLAGATQKLPPSN